jgi:hypothetical protein
MCGDESLREEVPSLVLRDKKSQGLPRISDVAEKLQLTAIRPCLPGSTP